MLRIARIARLSARVPSQVRNQSTVSSFSEYRKLAVQNGPLAQVRLAYPRSLFAETYDVAGDKKNNTQNGVAESASENKEFEVLESTGASA
ncbi:hypothetical protein CJU90_5193 [Yarrowia sp. C11]|nr:hypothetical protein CJU90_5193 [Yarrowia sp. C11]KAG5364992.1 hypothetical protein CKK34_3821 [Yarrowia sp. E02]